MGIEVRQKVKRGFMGGAPLSQLLPDVVAPGR
jgi:hypothetical protein